MSTAVRNAQRFTRDRRCPICGGAETDPRGQERRCTGYLSSDGKYAHCSREEIAGRIERTESSETYAHRLAGPCNCGRTHGEAEQRGGADIEAIYDYQDEHKRLLFQVVRKVGKQFRQRRPNITGERGADPWIWNTEGVRIVLYRLPELLAADPAAPVYIVEGEKDVDNLRARGCVATTNPRGAKKWTAVNDSARTALTGRHVVIIPDADAPGREHAEQVKRAIAPFVASIRVLELPGLEPPKTKDVSDWFVSCGGDAAKLEALRAAVPELDLTPWRTHAGARHGTGPAAGDGRPPPFDPDVDPVADRERASERAAGSAPGTDWPEPRPLAGRALPPVPAFDLALLPRELRFWVADIAERMQVAPDIVAVAAMAALSIIVANARTIIPKRYDTGWRVYPVLWGAVIAPPGSKKSPALGSVERVLDRIELRERERFEEARARRVNEDLAAKMIAEARAGEIKKRVKAAAAGKGETMDRAAVAALLHEEQEQETAADKLRRLKTTDTTVEKLGDLVENGKRRCRPMIVWRDELAGLLHSFEREGHESDRAFYLAGWSIQGHTTDRVMRGSKYLRDLAISIFGAMTPGPFGKYVREAVGSDGADGFLQRLQLMVYPDPITEWRHIDRAPDRVAEQRALDLFERLFAIDEDDEYCKPPALHFADDAQDLFAEWLCKLERQLHDPRNRLAEARASHLAKYRSLMPALALVCHLADAVGNENEPVSAAAAERAMKWCDFLDAHAERVYSLVNDGAWLDAELVRRIEVGKLAGTVKLRDIQRTLSDEVKADDVAASCEVLEEHGWLRLVKVQPKTGRPSLIVHVNPRGKAP